MSRISQCVGAALASAVMLACVTGCDDGEQTPATSQKQPAETTIRRVDKDAARVPSPLARNPADDGSESSSNQTVEAPPSRASMDCSSVARTYGPWQSVMQAEVQQDCTIVSSDVSDPSYPPIQLAPMEGGVVMFGAAGTVSWPLADGGIATVYPAGMQLQWFKDFTQESTDPTADGPRLMVTDADGSMNMVFVD